MNRHRTEVAVFADTNLGTRIAFPAARDITAGELKKDFEKVHFTCIPERGEIQVTGLMVKRKSRFYSLPDSRPLKNLFPRMTWFLHFEVMHLNRLRGPCLPHHASILSKHGNSMTRNCENTTRCNNEGKIIQGFHSSAHVLEENEATNHVLKEKGNSHEDYSQNNAASGTPERHSSMFRDKPTGSTAKSLCVMPENKLENPVESVQGSPSNMSTKAISVTGIINKYFSTGIDKASSSSNSDVTSRAVCSEFEVQSNTKSQRRLKRRVNSLSQFTPKTPQHVLHVPLNVDLVSKSSGTKSRKPNVGKRLLSASKSFGVSITNNSPSLSFCRFKDKKLLGDKSQINGSIFSISESDD